VAARSSWRSNHLGQKRLEFLEDAWGIFCSGWRALILHGFVPSQGANCPPDSHSSSLMGVLSLSLKK
jgi:hypothetical protein